MIEPLRMTFEVQCPVQHAFDVWTQGPASWWPANHTVTVEIEHRGWGRLGARGPGWRDANQSRWNGVLPDYIAVCSSAATLDRRST